MGLLLAPWVSENNKSGLVQVHGWANAEYWLDFGTNLLLEFLH